jgi:hypothetical protein
MPTPLTRVEVAFTSHPDDPVQVWTDVTADMVGDVTCDRGRSDEFSDAEPGRLTVVLRNTDGDYTHGNAAGAYYPNVLPGKRVRVSVSADQGATWWPRFSGYVDGWPMAWQQVVEQPRVVLTASDRLAQFGLMRTLRDAVHEQAGHASPTRDGSILG